MAENKNKVEITTKDYIHFQRLSQFVSNFTNGYVVCKECGAYIENGYRCFECDHDPSFDQFGTEFAYRQVHRVLIRELKSSSIVSVTPICEQNEKITNNLNRFGTEIVYRQSINQ